MQRPGLKWTLIFNLVIDLPMAVIMSVAGTLLARQPIVFFPNLVVSIAISFVLAFVINLILPIPKISMGFAGLFGIKPHTITESLVGNIPVCLILTVGISAPMTLFNLWRAGQIQMFWPAFLRSFLPLFAIMYVATFFLIPLAATVARNACRK